MSSIRFALYAALWALPGGLLLAPLWLCWRRLRGHARTHRNPADPQATATDSVAFAGAINQSAPQGRASAQQPLA